MKNLNLLIHKSVIHTTINNLKNTLNISEIKYYNFKIATNSLPKETLLKMRGIGKIWISGKNKNNNYKQLFKLKTNKSLPFKKKSNNKPHSQLNQKINKKTLIPK